MLRILLSMVAVFAFANSAYADHHEGGDDGTFKISGDLAFSWSMGDNEASAGSSIPHDNFAVNLAEIDLAKSMGNGSFSFTIAYGDTEAAFNPLITGATGRNNLNLLNANYTYKCPETGITFKVGKFQSAFGKETYNHRENHQFYRSDAYGMKSEFETGVQLGYMHEMFDITVAGVNNTSNVAPDDDRNKSFVVAANIMPMAGVNVDLDYAAGTERATAGTTTSATLARTHMHVGVGYLWNDMLDLSVHYQTVSNDLNGTTADASSLAAYVGYSMEEIGASLRYEMVTDDDGVVSATADNTLTNITINLNYDFDSNANIFFEYVMQGSDKKIYLDKDGAASDSDNGLFLGVLYKF